MKFTLPSLTYSYDALEPYIDAQTMEIHYTKHHQGYINNLNVAIEVYPDLQKKTVEELISDLSEIPQLIQTAVRNNGGGHANHTLFWQLMKQNGGGKPVGAVATAITKEIGSFEQMQEKFNEAARAIFGSGWAWLVVDQHGRLVVTHTANQDSPVSLGQKPILGLDVWEHAYYLKYQNKRVDYIDAFWHVINWEKVLELYEAAVSKI